MWRCNRVPVSWHLILKIKHQRRPESNHGLILLWPLGSARSCVEKHLAWVTVNLSRQESGIKTSRYLPALVVIDTSDSQETTK